jgi:threonine dehydrogenase-like Zn-dependent dehydrogenase
MKALLLERNLPRYVAARVLSDLLGSGRAVERGPLRLTDIDAPEIPGPGWCRLRPLLAGICGSDIATLDGRGPRSLEPLVSFPCVPGHEVVGIARGGKLDGERVVLEPVLGCAPRGTEPSCPACRAGQKGRCERLGSGRLRAGLQTGYCADTGGGWSAELVAHESQLHPIPVGLSDEAAVMVEPTACAVHAVRSVPIAGLDVAVVGAGTLGLCVTAALRSLPAPLESASSITVVAKYNHQRELASSLGATRVVAPSELTRAVRRRQGSFARLDHRGGLATLGGGIDVVFDCVGSSDSLTSALQVTRPGGAIVVVGMPADASVDLSIVWQRELRLVGSYTYGREATPSGERASFDLAIELVGSAGLGRLVSGGYPLEAYADAIAHAAEAGRRDAVKIVFDLRPGRPRPPTDLRGATP